MVNGDVWNYGEPTNADQLAGFNPATQCTDCFVPAGVRLSAVVVPKAAITSAVADSGDQQAISALHESRAMRMTSFQRMRFSSVVTRGLHSELAAEDAILEFQAIARGGDHTCYSNDSMLHRAIERMAGSISDPVFNSAELAAAVHANERWIRRCFQTYGVTPMSFRRFMRLAMVARFIGTVEGLNSTPKQVAERFGFPNPKYLAELYRTHFGVGLQDQHRQQMMLF
jgi:AraC-like DNA-binding protein